MTGPPIRLLPSVELGCRPLVECRQPDDRLLLHLDLIDIVRGNARLDDELVVCGTMYINGSPGVTTPPTV